MDPPITAQSWSQLNLRFLDQQRGGQVAVKEIVKSQPIILLDIHWGVESCKITVLPVIQLKCQFTDLPWDRYISTLW